MAFGSAWASRLLRGAAAAAVVAGCACAHAPAPSRAPAARKDAPDRVLVTGSRIPRPVGRDGLPVTDMPIKIYWRDDVARAGDSDLARALRKMELGAE